MFIFVRRNILSDSSIQFFSLLYPISDNFTYRSFNPSEIEGKLIKIIEKKKIINRIIEQIFLLKVNFRWNDFYHIFFFKFNLTS